jgi:SSS family solute:Na+ symporter
MLVQALIVAGFLLAVMTVGLLARRRGGGPEEFFLAGRSLGPVLLLLTMAATNFSAFTVFGFAGAGYRLGYAYYPIMAFGTGFMALTFILLGVPIWRAAKRLGAVSPPELIWLRFRSKPLRAVYLAVMVVFTLPYLAIQPMGAGYALQGLLGIPYVWGAVIVTAVVVVYVLAGGFRGVVWTDALQGFLVLVALLVVFFGLAGSLGGFWNANAQAFRRFPELFTRPGGGGQFTYGIWFSYLALWFLCDPMFPQLYQRFMAARTARSLRVTALFYPIVTGVLFFLPVAIGVMSRLIVPGLEGRETDSVLILAVARALPPWVGALALAAGLMALMSTMDSQLLTLSSMFVRDLGAMCGRPSVECRMPNGEGRVLSVGYRVLRGVLRKRVVVLGLAGVGLLLALRPWSTFLAIATEAFTGLAVLFPVTIAAVYWPEANPRAGLASIVVGEALVVLYHFGVLPALGLLPVVPVVAVAALVLVVGSLLFPAQGLESFARPTTKGLVWGVLFGVLFVAALDFWNWRQVIPMWWYLPGWFWHHVALLFSLFLAIGLYIRTRKRRGAEFFVRPSKLDEFRRLKKLGFRRYLR